MKATRTWISLILALGWAQSPLAQPPAQPQVIVQRPAGASGTTIVPDRFLRRWDPITLFFEQDTGPASGAPEDHPEQYFQLAPAHPGAARWLDARTLQFRPSEPWPALSRYTITAPGASWTLASLMEPPQETIPAREATGVDPIDSITMTFSDPLDPQALAKMVRVEIRPLPGLRAEEARWLTAEDFSIKSLERASRSDRASYVVGLRTPLPLGSRVTVHLRLSLEDSAEQSFGEFSFSTAEPFRILHAGCVEARFPMAPEGSKYTREQALNCGSEARAVVIEFSAPPQGIGPIEARNLVRFTPAVENLQFSLQETQLRVEGAFPWDTEIQLALFPSSIADRNGRALDMKNPSELYVYFPHKPSFLRWGAPNGVVERFGPRLVPIEGRGDERVDLRIYPVDPLDHSFWPMDEPITVDEAQRPPGPGEEPAPNTTPASVSDWERTSLLQRQLWGLSTSSPPVSTIVTLPLRKESASASFGLDLAASLDYLAGPNNPGTYLVGLRRLDGSTERTWIRIQATDLSLTTAEEPAAVTFAVTSLATAQPVAGATVRVELIEGNSWDNPAWTTLFEGQTDAQGLLHWDAPGSTDDTARQLRRIVVQKDKDTLVLDAQKKVPDYYHDNQWFPSDSYYAWLDWTIRDLAGRGAEDQQLCHIFTERPVYRPEDLVHIKGYVRDRSQGVLSIPAYKGTLSVTGPGDVAWKYPVELTEYGSFYQQFSHEKLPTGTYRAYLQDASGNTCGEVAWLMEAYQIPQFEMRLNGPDWAPLDKPFDVSLTASYYAGGRVAGRPVQWRVTQFPYTWTPKKLDGYFYSSDERYSNQEKFQSSPALEKQALTDEQGYAALTLDPTIEQTAQPRSYVIEATVTGADDQTVTSTRRIQALPPFALGLKIPRYLEKATSIEPEIIVQDPAGKFVAGQSVSVKLRRRQWHSHLQASDFSDGVARYITDIVDEPVAETSVTSGEAPVKASFPISKAGVYIVEIEAHDRLKRAQSVSVDLYAGGEGPVTWQKPASGVFTVATDQETYDPGQTANLVLRSPFQSGSALVIVEAPDKNRYEWLPVEGGTATYPLPIEATFVPRVPVHVILMRGRLPGSEPVPGSTTDLGKPSTMAATEWVVVNPVENQAKIDLEFPKKALPGQTIEMKIQLSNRNHEPLPGEVTLWLVDAAVLALGKEQRLDPLPDFITAVTSYLNLRDTRGLPFGLLPFSENPGGDMGEDLSMLDQSTVRRNFKPVPYYNPSILVDETGLATVQIQLPDNLTVFKVRAKVASGDERFGFATGELAVRLPVTVQPALPRFVRPGDQFTAAAIGRIVEGDGGPGGAELRTLGLELSGSKRRDFVWTPNQPQRLEFPVTVQAPPLKEDGSLAYQEVDFMVGVERASDGARDAIEVKLPIRDDRRRVTTRKIVDLEPGKSADWEAVPEAARPGTLHRSVLASDQPALIRMAAGLNSLLEYPYGCTEQRTSRAMSALAMQKFREALHQGAATEAEQEEAKRQVDRIVRDTLEWLPQVLDGNGLCAYWPGSGGNVTLTAWVVQFLAAAREAGYPVDAKLYQGLLRSLQQSLRSDYGHFVDGEEYSERTWALEALAVSGKLDPAYVAELARKTESLDVEGAALLLGALGAGGQAGSAAVAPLVEALWGGIVTRLYQGREVYGGLQATSRTHSALILPSETRAVAEALRSLKRLDPQNPKLQLLIDALVTLGQGDGWGTTNANAAALRALAEVLSPPLAGSEGHTITVSFDGKPSELKLEAASPVGVLNGASAGAGRLTHEAGASRKPVVVRLETSYVPAADGSQAPASAQGFVVTREMLKIRPGGAPPEKIALEQPARVVGLSVGDVIEEHVQLVNPQDRTYVAVVVPLAAGLEPLNPRLATAPPEAKPSGQITLAPAYTAFLDDSAAFYYDALPKGTYDFYFRTRATTEGSFIQPGALAEMMYDAAVRGNSPGARIQVGRE